MKVYLIGAGPGDPGLFTLKGAEILGLADVIIYDYLASASLLQYARSDAEIIYAGKKGGDHTLPQEAINRLIVDKAAAGKVVARLKGGDPYMFGRGGEEAEAILEAGIPFEVVPGVTSAIAAPAYAGIPLTHRAYASSVCFATGHEDPGKPETAHNWEALARSGSTLVFFMGVKNLPGIVANLIRSGMDPSTPSALIRWGTTPNQRSIISSLEELPEAAVRHGFAPPSLIVIGKVVTLRDKLNWFESKPLLGKGVVVTRSRGQGSDIAALLAEQGAAVIQFPTISIQPLDSYEPAHEAIGRLAEYDWILFTSVNGVSFFWDQLKKMSLDSRVLGAGKGLKVAAIGPATATALADRGIRPDFVPSTYVAEDMAQGLLCSCGDTVDGLRFLLARASAGREALPEFLEARGATVTDLPLYRTMLSEEGKERFYDALDRGQVDCITFASSSTVDNFFSLVPAERLKKHPDVKLACIGPVTASTLGAYGLSCHIQPKEHTVSGLVRAVAEGL